ncbi:MAG: prepilin-type N-terminal cleavage/methylation domain-containing protein [Patescibacteria group bacterium]
MKQQQGFTLIETLIAIFILTLSIGGLLTLAAGGYYSVRYSRNQITANNLLQESLEYVRNSRDTAFQTNAGWNAWIGQFESNGCMTTSGCMVDPYTTNIEHVLRCNGACDALLFFPDAGFYGYGTGAYPSAFRSSTAAVKTNYIRTVTMKKTSTDQAVFTVKVQWLNGSNIKSATQSELITSWHL